MNYTIATIGSHSALQILKGAKDEGFSTLLFCLQKNTKFYRRFLFIDRIVAVKSYDTLPIIKHCILIPHGSFVAYIEDKRQNIPYFGNKKVLDWEEDRSLQRKWLTAAGINVPEEYSRTRVRFPVIVKSFGAAGGAGYAFAVNKKELSHAIGSMGTKKYVIQQYIVGVTCYLHYFYSPISDTVELMSIDRRYETNADGLGRIPFLVSPSFVVVGNSPLVLRESLLPEVYAMGERIIQASRKLIDNRGLIGPFCLETIITPDQQFITMEISCRIVAGTNLFVEGSPYTAFTYNEPMSTGRRIAREIKLAIGKNKLSTIIDV